MYNEPQTYSRKSRCGPVESFKSHDHVHMQFHSTKILTQRRLYWPISDVHPLCHWTFADAQTGDHTGIPISAQSLLCLWRILHFLHFPVALVANLACQHSTQGSGGMVCSHAFWFTDFIVFLFCVHSLKTTIDPRRWTVDFLFFEWKLLIPLISLKAFIEISTWRGVLISIVKCNLCSSTVNRREMLQIVTLQND